MSLSFFWRGILYVVLGLVAFVSVFPFYWMVVGSTNSSIDIIKGKVSFGSELFVNIGNLLAQVDVPRVLFNSAYLAIATTLLTLIISSFAGYGFEIFRSRARENIFAIMLLLLSIPFAALMVPLFILIAKLGLINSYTAIILPAIASIFIIFYFRQSTKAFPSELRDAGRVDGLKEWQIFLFIYLPSMRSTYATATIMVFMGNWNSYLWPLIVLQTKDKQTIMLSISALSSAYTVDYGLVMLSTVLATLPTLLIFFLLQRLFVEGLVGSVK